MDPRIVDLLQFWSTSSSFGSIALLTPAAWPMLLVTFGFFARQCESKNHRPFVEAAVLGGTIISSMSVTGIAVAGIFGASALNSLVNSVPFVVALLVVNLALVGDLLGLFPFRDSKQTWPLIAVFVFGLMVTFSTIMGTFVFLGTLFIAAAQGALVWPILGLLGFGGAFASPFCLLAIVPSYLKKLRSGKIWLRAIRIIALLVVLKSVYDVVSILIFITSPPEPAASSPDKPDALTIQQGGIVRFLDFDQAKVRAKEMKRPLFLNFTAFNAVNSRLMEITFGQESIRSRLEKFVVVDLYLDKIPKLAGSAEEARLVRRNQELQDEITGDPVIPCHAIVMPDGTTILAQHVGLERDVDKFAAFLDAGWKEWGDLQALTNER